MKKGNWNLKSLLYFNTQYKEGDMEEGYHRGFVVSHWLKFMVIAGLLFACGYFTAMEVVLK